MNMVELELREMDAELYTPVDPGQLAFTAPDPAPTTVGQELEKQAVCFHLTIRQAGKWRKADIDQVVTDADKNSLGLRKEIIADKRYDALYKLTGEVRTWIEGKVLPSFFRRGVYLLPTALLVEVDTYLRQAKEKQQALLDEFLLAYEEVKEDARERLKGQFKDKDYPAPNVLRSKFDITWDYEQYAQAPMSLKDLNADLFSQQQQKYSELWDEVYQNARMFLRSEMSEMVNKLVERLTPDADGKPKTFKKSTVNALNDFLDYFDARNITNDTELAEQVQKARRVLSGYGIKDLRNKEAAAREIVQKGLARVAETLNQPDFVEKINRVYDFEE
jgi:hypothetical protein